MPKYSYLLLPIAACHIQKCFDSNGYSYLSNKTYCICLYNTIDVLLIFGSIRFHCSRLGRNVLLGRWLWFVCRKIETLVWCKWPIFEEMTLNNVAIFTVH